MNPGHPFPEAGQASPDLAKENQSLKESLAKAEAELQQLKQKLAQKNAMLDGFSEGLLLMDDKFLECNEAACRIWSCEEKDIIGYFASDFAPDFQPDGTPSFESAQGKVKQALRGDRQRFEWVDTRKDGVIINTEVALNRVRVHGHDYVLATFRDITERKALEAERADMMKFMENQISERTAELVRYNQALSREINQRIEVEKDLERAYQELSQIFETSGEGLVVVDADYTISKANKAFLDLSGRKPEDVMRRTCQNMLPCKHCGNGDCIIDEALSGKDFVSKDIDCLRAGKEEVTCIVTCAAMRNRQGEASSAVANFRDVTEHRRWITMLENSEELHRVILENISDAVFITDDYGEFCFISANVEKIFGLTVEQAQELGNIKRLLPQVPLQDELMDKNEEINNLEMIISSLGAEDRTLNLRIKKVNIQGGTHLITCQDISEKKRMEEEAKREYEQLVQAGKLVSLGILVSGVAHEVNNPNNFILLNSSLLGKVWEDTKPILDEYYEEQGDFLLGNLDYATVREKLPNLFKGINQGAHRIKRIVTGLKDYARQGSRGMNEVLSINQVVQAALTLLANQIKKTTNEFIVNYGMGIPHFLGNFQKVEQVIINVVQNSLDALTDSGQSICVQTNYDKTQRLIRVTVKDQGKGIDPKDLPHIQDPFFTTKRTCGGTGLGLAISSRIIEEHLGFTRISSRKGYGTTVEICFPVRSEAS